MSVIAYHYLVNIALTQNRVTFTYLVTSLVDTY